MSCRLFSENPGRIPSIIFLASEQNIDDFLKIEDIEEDILLFDKNCVGRIALWCDAIGVKGMTFSVGRVVIYACKVFPSPLIFGKTRSGR
jgi:hypothetical protein